MTDALADVVAERASQDAKWGEQNHHPLVWLGILTEEVGELARSMLAEQFPTYQHGINVHDHTVRHEAIQVAAVAIALVECLDRCKVTSDE
jgi:NTP pyrophosphatase (non-canonical NTP hydrolase)